MNTRLRNILLFSFVGVLLVVLFVKYPREQPPRETTGSPATFAVTSLETEKTPAAPPTDDPNATPPVLAVLSEPAFVDIAELFQSEVLQQGGFSLVERDQLQQMDRELQMQADLSQATLKGVFSRVNADVLVLIRKAPDVEGKPQIQLTCATTRSGVVLFSQVMPVTKLDKVAFVESAVDRIRSRKNILSKSPQHIATLSVVELKNETVNRWFGVAEEKAFRVLLAEALARTNGILVLDRSTTNVLRQESATEEEADRWKSAWVLRGTISLETADAGKIRFDLQSVSAGKGDIHQLECSEGGLAKLAEMTAYKVAESLGESAPMPGDPAKEIKLLKQTAARALKLHDTVQVFEAVNSAYWLGDRSFWTEWLRFVTTESMEVQRMIGLSRILAPLPFEIDDHGEGCVCSFDNLGGNHFPDGPQAYLNAVAELLSQGNALMRHSQILSTIENRILTKSSPSDSDYDVARRAYVYIWPHIKAIFSNPKTSDIVHSTAIPTLYRQFMQRLDELATSEDEKEDVRSLLADSLAFRYLDNKERWMELGRHVERMLRESVNYGRVLAPATYWIQVGHKGPEADEWLATWDATGDPTLTFFADVVRLRLTQDIHLPSKHMLLGDRLLAMKSHMLDHPTRIKGLIDLYDMVWNRMCNFTVHNKILREGWGRGHGNIYHSDERLRVLLPLEEYLFQHLVWPEFYFMQYNHDRVQTYEANVLKFFQSIDESHPQHSKLVSKYKYAEARKAKAAPADSGTVVQARKIHHTFDLVGEMQRKVPRTRYSSASIVKLELSNYPAYSNVEGHTSRIGGMISHAGKIWFLIQCKPGDFACVGAFDPSTLQIDFFPSTFRLAGVAHRATMVVEDSRVLVSTKAEVGILSLPDGQWKWSDFADGEQALSFYEHGDRIMRTTFQGAKLYDFQSGKIDVLSSRRRTPTLTSLDQADVHSTRLHAAKGDLLHLRAGPQRSVIYDTKAATYQDTPLEEVLNQEGWTAPTVLLAGRHSWLKGDAFREIYGEEPKPGYSLTQGGMSIRMMGANSSIKIVNPAFTFPVLHAKGHAGEELKFPVVFRATDTAAVNVIEGYESPKLSVLIFGNELGCAYTYDTSSSAHLAWDTAADIWGDVNGTLPDSAYVIISENHSVEHGAIWDAIAAKRLDRLQAYLDAGGDPDAKSPDGLPLLFLAAKTGYSAAVNMLIEARANPNVLTDWDGANSPLYQAIDAMDVESARILIKAGADVNAGVRGVLPINSALVLKQYRILDMLIDAGVDVLKPCTQDGLNAVEYSIVVSDLQLIDYFRKKGVDIKKVEGGKGRALRWAIKKNNIGMFRYFLDLGYTVDESLHRQLLDDLVQSQKSSVAFLRSYLEHVGRPIPADMREHLIQRADGNPALIRRIQAS